MEIFSGQGSDWTLNVELYYKRIFENADSTSFGDVLQLQPNGKGQDFNLYIVHNDENWEWKINK